MKAFLVLLFVPVIAVAGKNALTGNVRMDLLAVMSADSLPQTKGMMVESDGNRAKLKSPFLGGAMSLLIPGAGEFYSERFVKGGIFFAIEVAAVTAALVYNSRGNRKTDEFQTYADLHWSAVRYAKYIVAHGAPDYGPVSANIPITEDPSLPPWEQVNFGNINAWESGPHSEGFSHTLPPHGDQQDDELIGKYEQFKSGWDTYPTDSQGIPVSDHNDYHGLVPQQMKDYAAERGKANDFYYLAETATAFIVVNHIISALDGAWSTAQYNKEVTSEVGMQLLNIGGGEMTMATQLRVKVRL